MTGSFISSIFLDPATPFWYFAQYFIYILSFAIVDAASIVQTLYLNYQTNKVSKVRYNPSLVEGQIGQYGHKFVFHETSVDESMPMLSDPNNTVPETSIREVRAADHNKTFDFMSLNSIMQNSVRDDSNTTLRMYSIANKQRLNLLDPSRVDISSEGTPKPRQTTVADRVAD